MTEDGAGHLELCRRTQGELGGPGKKKQEVAVGRNRHVSFQMDWPMAAVSHHARGGRRGLRVSCH